MALDTELEQEDTEGNTQVEDTSKDSSSTSREDIVNDTYDEGIEEAIVDALADKTDITLDDLRQIPGTEGMSDEQLQAAWDKAQKDEGIGSNADAATKVELPFPVYDDRGNKIASDKVTLGDLLSGKALVGYNAMGKEQRKSLSDVLRNASQGHWNEHRYTTVQGQYKEATQKLTSAEKELTSAREMQKQWESALTAISMGNSAPMAAIVNAYKAALGKTNATPEGFVPQDQVAAERENAERGMQWWTDVGMPAAYDIASNYKADAKEVQGAIQYYINNEPNLTPDRIEEIIKYDVPMLLEQNGYKAGVGVVATSGSNGGNVDEIAELKKQIAALSGRVASDTNTRTNTIREKGKKTPPAGSGATGGAGDSMPSFKSRQEMKDYLQS